MSNHMEEVAKMFGKKLNEDFKAVIWDSIMECRFTNGGLEIKLDNGLYRNKRTEDRDNEAIHKETY